MIRPAKSHDHAQLKTLWMTVFGDSPEEVDTYFALRHHDKDMLVWEENGRIDAMLSMLPLTLTFKEKRYPVRYIYAVATLPAQRGRGLASLLLKRAAEESCARGEAAHLLVPASESLFNYYLKRGYQPAFSLNVTDFEATALPSTPQAGVIAPCDADDYTRIRDKAFSSQGLYACWDKEAVSYALGTLSDGGASHIKTSGGEGVAAWTRTQSGILIKELALLGIELPTALALLHQMLQSTTYRVHLPAGTLKDSPVLPFGMARWFIPPPVSDALGYLSLAMD